MTGAPGLVAISRETWRALMGQPGRLANDFAAGMKRVGPVTLFVIAAIVFAGVRVGAARVAPAELSTPAMDAEMRARLEALPISAETRENVITMYEHRREIARTTAWESAAVMICLVPVFALLLQVTYSGEHRPYALHLAFSLDYFAAILFAEALSTIVDPLNVTLISVLAGLAVLVWVSWYTIEAMKTFYGGSTGETVLRATMVSLAYLVVYTACMTGAAAFTLFLAERSQ